MGKDNRLTRTWYHRQPWLIAKTTNGIATQVASKRSAAQEWWRQTLWWARARDKTNKRWCTSKCTRLLISRTIKATNYKTSSAITPKEAGHLSTHLVAATTTATSMQLTELSLTIQLLVRSPGIHFKVQMPWIQSIKTNIIQAMLRMAWASSETKVTEQSFRSIKEFTEQ